jgi:tetratricopeptide (TPR) repeat protein
MNNSTTKIWEEKVVIPTYEVGKPDKNPMFFEKRIYQGSSGVVYPNPIIEKVFDEKVDREYSGVFLENDFLKVMILPELGGRVQTAYDKIRQRHFIYHNRVIKPALVGLCGPWISGGIEFNWPQHHRPSTFEPVDYSIEDNNDGSKTIWVNEVERMFGTKGMAGFTLHPDKAYLEIKVQLYNRTPLPQTFLWWANPAVKVNDHYQSVFPPDVNAVFDHGKRDVSSFPIATGTYYKVNYAPGTDISRYKNIPVPTSYMAINSDYDFVGGYEHDTRAGLLHVADHHVSPGKKQWTWGHSDFGQAWDRNLTDEDGPYIELMTGVFTDNQPDFSWLMPYEEKSFTQYFLPYTELGVVKNASKDLLFNVEKHRDQLFLKLFGTSEQKVRIHIVHQDTTLFEQLALVGPKDVFHVSFKVGEHVNDNNILALICNEAGIEVLRYDPLSIKNNEVPLPAKAASAPKEVENNEQLFLTGQHLEQYRHATYSPVLYYEEALDRDPKDIRCNNALGLWYLRKGQFEKGELHFREAIKTATERNPNPYDAEPYYNLGVCLKMLGRHGQAYEAFYKSVWSSAWQDAGYFSLAQIDMERCHYRKAVEHADHALERNGRNGKAYVLKIAGLRKLGDFEEALNTCAIGLTKDRFNLSIYFEQYRIYTSVNNDLPAQNAIGKLKGLARGNVHNYIEYALDYASAGLFEEAIELLDFAVAEDKRTVYPMVLYYLGWLHHKIGNNSQSLQLISQAAIACSDRCFPNKLEDIEVLQSASEQNTSDAKAPFYLGNFWYDKRQYENAVEQWELSLARDKGFPTVWRNLGMAYFNKNADPKRALSAYEKAFELDPSDARVLMELDQLYKRMNKTPEERLAFLENHLTVVEERDDLYLERAALYNSLGQYEMAYQLIMKRKFHPWEGGEGKVSSQYVYSLVEMAKELINTGGFVEAIELLKKAQYYPHNLGEGKLFGAQENDIFYWLACAFEQSADVSKSTEFFRKAGHGLSEPTAAMFYNDQQPDKIFYQVLALRKIGEQDKADEICSKLIAYGKEHLNDNVKIDYFAVSLPDLLIFEDDLNARNRIHCHYMIGLGYLGLSELEKAKNEFTQALQVDGMHFGCKTHLKLALSLGKQRVKVG